ncbi:MAG: ATP-grasp domain protein [Gemmataceae bacterium]|nr:ATP-grasp domain protein [Gemmataceae bacterium]
MDAQDIRAVDPGCRGVTVGVVGTSARAAVMSLARAGYPAWAVDLFADRDLRRLAPCARCPAGDYPAALADLTAPFPAGPVMYTGGLENAPAVVRDLVRRRPLWGNGPEVLEQARNPFALADRLGSQGVLTPLLIRPGSHVPPVGRWVRKAFRSSGGYGVSWAGPGEIVPAGFYAQELVDGPAMSAQFVSSADRTILLGVTDQLVGEGWLHAGPFAYCGNVGPVPVSADLRETLTRVGDVVGGWAGLRGLWGVDFVLRGGYHAYLIDLNPRYTAALEVLEHASGCALIAAHAAAFDTPFPEHAREYEPTAPPFPRKQAGESGSVVGKAVYFAPRPLVFPSQGPWDTDIAGEFDPWRLPAFADVPFPGEAIVAGSPVLTFFAADSTPAGCRAKLERRAADLDRLFQPPKAEPELTHDAERTREPGGGRAGADRRPVPG